MPYKTFRPTSWSMEESGYMEIFMDNQLQTPVFFDNLVVSHTPSQILEVNTYYPYGMLMQGSDMTFQSAIKDEWNGYKYSGKELQTELSLNWGDHGARMMDYTLGRWWVPDPLAEKYYNISPYAYAGNNPINNIDPNGLDYWSTNDPEEIRRLLETLKLGGNKWEGFNYGSWNHVSDKDFLYKTEEDGTLAYEEDGTPTYKITYNDVSRTFYTSYSTIENGEVVIHGVSFKAVNSLVSIDGFAAVENRFHHIPTGGGLENTYPEAIIGGSLTKAGMGLLRYFWRSMTNTISTTNTFDANSGFAAGNTEKMGKSKGNMSGNRIIQQEQFDAVVTKLGLNQAQAQQLHRAIHGQGYGYQEILQEAKFLFNK